MSAFEFLTSLLFLVWVFAVFFSAIVVGLIGIFNWVDGEVRKWPSTR